jgi:hypothetical protein
MRVYLPASSGERYLFAKITSNVINETVANLRSKIDEKYDTGK